ncbi:hypothetical protein [Ligilactobacillus ruminis]|uniref:hypothetical protein n=1 Tax=Ligilactobacillus ruminis TaxID=1623 RepID=UPI0021F08357|nr:hypothetical protein [Ligilactobacillus ruminis]
MLFLLVSSSSAYASSISGGYVELSSSNLKSPVSVIKEGGLSLFKAKVKGKGLTPYQWHYIDGGKWLFGVYGTKVHRLMFIMDELIQQLLKTEWVQEHV